MLTYVRQIESDEPIIAALQELAERFPDRGFGKYCKRIRRYEHGWNHKRVCRMHCALELNRRWIGKKRLSPRQLAPLVVPAEINATDRSTS